MVVNDPIADMLTRIRNAIMARHDSVLVPFSKMKLAIAKILKEEGFIKDYEIVRGKPSRTIKIHLRYFDDRTPAITGLKRVSKPGLRVYVGRDEIPRVYSGLGVAILSTSKGIRTGQQAFRMRCGGELLCYVW
ncbi:MAG: 30S ribosomal protein S8 [Dehalococcoidales bacterium]|nr:30S ribosomal protein S8 [Dehalococcoidales bacterium]